MERESHGDYPEGKTILEHHCGKKFEYTGFDFSIWKSFEVCICFMDRWQLKTPVAFLIFNRPLATAKVFAEIAAAKPPKLLVVADGPRPGQQGETEQCYAARQIVERVDWDCQMLTNYSDVNLGCKRRVSSGLDWVFENVEEAIVLEDDCLPHSSFFRFCQELLERYRDEERIAHIGGVNFQFGRRRTNYSYYFSRYTHIWGWASWRRAWRRYDVGLEAWPSPRAENGHRWMAAHLDRVTGQRHQGGGRKRCDVGLPNCRAHCRQ